MKRNMLLFGDKKIKMARTPGRNRRKIRLIASGKVKDKKKCKRRVKRR